MEHKGTNLQDVLSGTATLLLDGAMGSLLAADGAVAPGRDPDMLNLESPGAITAIHRAFVNAGAQAVTSNTFRANRLKLAGSASVYDIYTAAYSCARAADPWYVAADVGPLGQILEPYGDLAEDEAYELFAEQMHVIDGIGYDFILIETMTDLNEAVLAVKAAKDNSSLPVFVTMSFESSGFTMFGADPAAAAKGLAGAGADCIGMNCSVGPHEAAAIVSAMRSAVSVPVICQPNAGLPRFEDGATVYDVAPHDFCEAMKDVLDAGATIVGGCCGTTPAFIRSLKDIL